MKSPVLVTLAFSLLAAVTLAERSVCTDEQLAEKKLVGFTANMVFVEEVHEKNNTPYNLNERGTDDYRTQIPTEFTKVVRLHLGYDNQLFVVYYAERRLQSNPVDKMWFFGDVESDLSSGGDGDAKTKMEEIIKFGVAKITEEIANVTNVDRSLIFNDENLSVKGKVSEFDSFFYGHDIYFEFAHLSSTFDGPFQKHDPQICQFVSNVVDPAAKSLTCKNRFMENEQFIAITNGMEITQSAEFCPSSVKNEQRERLVVPVSFAGLDSLGLPEAPPMCYFMKTGDMNKPCFFAFGNPYLFQQVQLVPNEPIQRSRSRKSTSTSTPHVTSNKTNRLQGDSNLNVEAPFPFEELGTNGVAGCVISWILSFGLPSLAIASRILYAEVAVNH